ncbi:hypothetical protein [uncultured Desulfuromonas sp.]|uniref:hypothetical protein n=1 Tax=uncultured Desulfuromonas sp. TaxID=181013 RepID=UPI00374CCE78
MRLTRGLNCPSCDDTIIPLIGQQSLRQRSTDGTAPVQHDAEACRYSLPFMVTVDGRKNPVP